MDNENIELKVSKMKTSLILLASIFGFYFTYFIFQLSETEFYLRFIFGAFMFLLSSFFLLGFIKSNLQKYGTGVLTKEGFFDNHLKITFLWKDIDIFVFDVLNQRRVSIKIDNFDLYTKGINPEKFKPHLKSFSDNESHIKLPFPLLNQSLDELIENLNKLTENSMDKVEVFHFNLNSEEE